MLFKHNLKWPSPIRCVPTFALLVALCSHAQTGTITGQVFCADTQKPARFAAIISKSGARVYSQVDGTFVLKDVPVGSQQLEVHYPGYIQVDNWDRLRKDADTDTIGNLNNIESQAQTTVLPGQAASAIITIFRGAELDGTITYDDGSPAVDFEVSGTYVVTLAQGTSNSAIPARPKWGPSNTTKTDTHGHFEITGLIGGIYIVSTRGPERFAPFSTYFGNTVEASKATQVTVKDSEERTGLDIQVGLSNLHQVSGVLKTVNRRPIAKKTVQLSFAEDTNNEEVRLTTTSEDGSFVFPAVPDGAFVLQSGEFKSKIQPLPVIVTGRDITDIILTAHP